MGRIAAEGIPEQAALDRPHLLILSSPDELALLDACETLRDELTEDDVVLSTKAQDLSARHAHNVHRAFVVTRDADVSSEDFVLGIVNSTSPPKICLLFTGQGAQWPQMGKELLATFSVARAVIAEVDEALHQVAAEPPSWSIAAELTACRTREHYGRPEIAQTLTTAVQLAIVAVYQHWGVQFEAVIGHSSGEIAAACAAGLLSRTEAIVTAYYCGWAASNCEERPSFDTGMLAAGTDPDAMEQLLQQEAAEQVKIACYNGPRAVTLSGPVKSLKKLKLTLDEQGRQTSLLNSPVAYHHPSLMEAIGRLYESKLEAVLAVRRQTCGVSMLSTVTTDPIVAAADAAYWKNNILSPVRFEETLTKTLSGVDAPTILIEVGPAGSLAGAVLDIKAKLGAKGADVAYYKSMNRGRSSITPMFQAAGGLFVAGFKLDLALVNR